MKRWLKIIIWVLVGIVGIAILGYGGCAGCVRIIAKSNSCEMYNIDNVELRAHIDVPSIKTAITNINNSFQKRITVI